MTNLCNDNHMPRLNTKMFDIGGCEVDYSAEIFRKQVDGDMDEDYQWLLNSIKENENEHDNGNENEGDYDYDDDDDEDEDEDAIKVEDKDEYDPQYVMFLKNLTENGNLYKLKISKDDDDPEYLEYEKDEQSDGFDDPQALMLHNGDKSICIENQRAKRMLVKKIAEISTLKEVTKKNKITEHESITEPQQNVPVDSDYNEFLKSQKKPSEDPPVFIHDGKLVKYEGNGTSYDAELMVLENAQACREASTKQKEPSLKEKLICILKKPYNRKEHKGLSKILEKKKPVCRLLPLRNSDVSSAIEGAEKSALENGPGFFLRKLEVAYAQNDQLKALNLLRIFRFWLEYLPDEQMFQPWLDRDILNLLRLR